MLYPDLPQSAADLVPLPRCDGPKLKPFDFQGASQDIKFLEHLGEGLHAHVFKVEIRECVYALKLFRFVYHDDYMGPADDADPEDLELMSAFYHYSEPFSAECRAFGRLQEAGCGELAVPCFGYVLLDEEHERSMMNQFSKLGLEFNGNGDNPGVEDVRSRFLGRDGRPPPLRGIVKAFGSSGEPLRAKYVRRVLRDVVRLQQLGIFHLDVGHRQLISGKLADFSLAVTIPHFLTNPELNPRLTPKDISAMEYETFQLSINDYWEFDDMIRTWNFHHDYLWNQISVYAFPDGLGCRTRPGLRSTPSRRRVYSFVDPRRFDWRAFTTAAPPSATGGNGGRGSGRKAKGSRRRSTKEPPRVARRWLTAKPPRWYYDCDGEVAEDLKRTTSCRYSLEWEVKDGFIFPRERT